MDKRTMYVIYSLKSDRWSDYELCKRLNTYLRRPYARSAPLLPSK